MTDKIYTKETKIFIRDGEATCRPNDCSLSCNNERIKLNKFQFKAEDSGGWKDIEVEYWEGVVMPCSGKEECKVTEISEFQENLDNNAYLDVLIEYRCIGKIFTAS